MQFNPAGLAIPIFVFFMAVEWLWLRAQGRRLHRLNDSLSSLNMGLLLLTSDALLKTLTFGVFIYLYDQYRLFEFSMGSPVPWLIFFLGVDFCYYWFHRCAHRWNILWGAHVGHHQSEEYNLTTALRQSAFQYAFSWVFYLPLAILGCSPWMFLAQFSILKMYQFWLHTQAIGRIPLMEGIFSTPSSHRVHHAKNSIYVDKNYGGTLVIWDRLFGTWQPELASETCHYGTTKPLSTWNPVRANLQHWGMLFRDTLKTKHWRDKLRLWIMPTGWRPQDCLTVESDNPIQHMGCQDREKFDPSVSRWGKAYAALSMFLLGIYAIEFLFLSPILDPSEKLMGAALLVWSTLAIGWVLETHYKALIVEPLRQGLVCLAVFHWSTASDFTTIEQSVELHTPAPTAFEYMTQPNLWHEWHHQSLSVTPELGSPYEKDTEFREKIQTLLGVDDMQWTVMQYDYAKTWEAHAYNETKGANIQLRYVYEPINSDKVLLTRRLTYETPNFLLTALNRVYFKGHMERQSMAALTQLSERWKH